MTSFVRQLAPRLSACLGLLIAAACCLLLLRSVDVTSFDGHVEDTAASSIGNLRDQRHAREDILWQSMGGFLAG